MASLQYLSTGDTGVARERIEIFSGGVIALIEDFRRLEIVGGGRKRVRRRGSVERGHREELKTFLDLATGGTTDVLTAADVFWSSALTLQVMAALATGGQAMVDLPGALGGRGASWERIDEDSA